MRRTSSRSPDPASQGSSTRCCHHRSRSRSATRRTGRSPASSNILSAGSSPGGGPSSAGWKKNWESFSVYTSWGLGAEYLAQLVPRGTHEYAKFIRPSELEAWARAAGLTAVELRGMRYNPLLKSASIGNDMDVNYLMHYRRVAHPVLDLALLRLKTMRVTVTGGFLFRFGAGALPFPGSNPGRRSCPAGSDPWPAVPPTPGWSCRCWSASTRSR